MSVIAEISLGIQVAELIQKVVRLSRESREMLKKGSMNGEISKWNDMLTGIDIVLRDAEEQQSSRDGVRAWLQQLDHLALDVEDIVEEFNYEFYRRHVAPKAKSWLYGAVDAVKFAHKMKAKSRGITVRFEKMTELKRQLDLVGNGRSSRGNAYLNWKIPPLGSVQDGEPSLCGRKQEELILLKGVLSNNENDRGIGVIPVVGMGGIGKTTLARHIFEASKVKEAFSIRAWFSVSQDYDFLIICNGLLEDITGTHSSLSNLNTVLKKLSEVLQGKKYLIVFDDLWNDREADWRALKAALGEGLLGSKIIVTTRKQSVASMVKSGDVCVSLEPMSDEECWKLFCRHAGVDPSEFLGSDKERIGREVVRRCGGLPLAVAVLGGALMNTGNMEHWKDLLSAKSDRQLDVMSVLRHSYNDLSSEMKRCFSMFAMFPEDFKYKENRLVRMWLAAGFVKWSEMKIGESGRLSHRYFEEFKRRSLLLGDGRMHDMVRDLACEVAGKSCYSLNGEKRIQENGFEKGRTRHLYFLGYDSLGSLDGPGVLRTIQIRDFDDMDPPRNALHHVFSNFRCLRTLILNFWEPKLPDSIGKLIHLRNVDFRYSGIKGLPDSFTQLYNLQIFSLKNCRRFATVPEDIGNLKDLKLMNLSRSEIVSLPDSVGSLSNLEILKLKVCSGLAKLPDKIGNLRNLKILDLSCCGNIDKLPDSVVSLQNLEVLNLRLSKRLAVLPEDIGGLTNLRLLNVSRCENIKELPESVGRLSKLEEMDISGCERLVEIPSSVVGLSSLKVLNMQCCYSLALLPHGIGTLKNLKVLNMSDCANIMELPESVGCLSSLQELNLRGCRNLIQLPSSLICLSNLAVLNMQWCTNLTTIPQGIEALKSLKLFRYNFDNRHARFGRSLKGSVKEK